MGKRPDPYEQGVADRRDGFKNFPYGTGNKRAEAWLEGWRAEDARDRDEFTKQVTAAHARIGSIDEMARRAMTSRPTIVRWLDGTSAPHRFGRDSAIRALQD